MGAGAGTWAVWAGTDACHEGLSPGSLWASSWDPPGRPRKPDSWRTEEMSQCAPRELGRASWRWGTPIPTRPGDGEKQTWVYRQATWGRPGPAVACAAQSWPLSARGQHPRGTSGGDSHSCKCPGGAGGACHGACPSAPPSSLHLPAQQVNGPSLPRHMGSGHPLTLQCTHIMALAPGRL